MQMTKTMQFLKSMTVYDFSVDDVKRLGKIEPFKQYLRKLFGRILIKDSRRASTTTPIVCQERFFYMLSAYVASPHGTVWSKMALPLWN